MHLEEKTLESNLVYDGKIIKLYRDKARLENDREVFREVIKHPGGVCVVPLTDDNKVIMVEQFRYPTGKVLTEIPAGKLEWGENHFDCGKRELNLSQAEQKLDADEFLDVKKIPFDKAVEMVMNGEITDAKTQLALLKTKVLLENENLQK